MFLRVLLTVCGLLFSSASIAQLEIQVTRGIDNPTSIAVAPFAWDGLGPKCPMMVVGTTGQTSTF